MAEEKPVARFKCGTEVWPGKVYPGIRIDWVWLGTQEDRAAGRFGLTFTFLPPASRGGGSCMRADEQTEAEWLSERAYNYQPVLETVDEYDEYDESPHHLTRHPCA